MHLSNKHMITSTVLVMTAQSVFTFGSCVATDLQAGINYMNMKSPLKYQPYSKQ